MKHNFVEAVCAVALLVCPLMAGQDELPSALRLLVETERSFATRCRDVGIRASFLEFFADSAIAFTPEPVRYKEAVKNLPAPDPHAVRLEWEPQAGDISSSSDLGFTTGPSIRTNVREPGSPRRYGQFLSVWKKQSDGSWKVVADIGVSAPTEVSPPGTPFSRYPDAAASAEAHSEEIDDPADLDRELTKLCALKGLRKGFLSRSSDAVRLLREDHVSIAGVKDVQSYLEQNPSTANWSPISGEMSRAGDLCYAYGSYELKSNPGGSIESGYYLHVWKRDVHGTWRLVADATNPNARDRKK